MNPVAEASSGDRQRACLLWACTGLFFLRVIGQLEALMLSPPWLPPMSDWYSGLIPYPILVPLQIAILMAMTAVTLHEMRAGPSIRSNRWQPWFRRFAVVYFVVMLLRLIVQLLRGAGDVIDAGGIPVAFHWILALFLLVFARPDIRVQRAGRQLA